MKVVNNFQTRRYLTLTMFLLLIFFSPTHAQQQTTSKAETGSSSVLINGKQAKRVGDLPAGTQGSPNVFINGKPALTVGGAKCKEGQLSGSSNVFINGKPVAVGGGSCKE